MTTIPERTYVFECHFRLGVVTLASAVCAENQADFIPSHRIIHVKDGHALRPSSCINRLTTTLTINVLAERELDGMNFETPS